MVEIFVVVVSSVIVDETVVDNSVVVVSMVDDNSEIRYKNVLYPHINIHRRQFYLNI